MFTDNTDNTDNDSRPCSYFYEVEYIDNIAIEIEAIATYPVEFIETITL